MSRELAATTPISSRHHRTTPVGVNMLLLSAIPLLAILSAARALPPPRPGTPAFVRPRPSIPHLEAPSEELPVVSRNGTQLPAYTKTYYFNQLIDHNNPSLGTFRQQYWHTYEFYEPGGSPCTF